MKWETNASVPGRSLSQYAVENDYLGYCVKATLGYTFRKYEH